MSHPQHEKPSKQGDGADREPTGAPTSQARDARAADAEPEITLESDATATAGSSRILSSGLVKRLSAHAPAATRYKVEGEIARGGMGAILKVWDEDLRRTLAMKVILGRGKSDSLSETPEIEDTVMARFLEEAQVTGQLDHPGVVPVHELGLGANGRVYFTMRLVKGSELKEIIDHVHARREGWTQTKAIGVVLKVCEAMAYAHSKGVIHRDLKPANIMVGRFGETYVMDWGLAKVIGRKDRHDLRLKKVQDAMPSLVRVEREEMRPPDSDSPLVTMDGTIVGTPAYMPPEQAKGLVEEMTVRSDVYAVGAMLYHLLTGESPYVPRDEKISPLTVLRMVVEGPPKRVHEIRRDVPAELVAISDRAMARDAAARYADMMEMANDLQAYLEGRVVRAYQTGAVAEFKKWIDRNRGMAAALAAAVLVLVAGLAVSSSLFVRAKESAELARANAARADAKAAEAESNAERARASEKEVRERSYSANLRAAASSLSANDIADCRRNLDACPADLRGWEWRYLELGLDTSLRAIRVPKGEVKSLFGTANPRGSVTSAAFSPDGSKLLLGCDSGPAETWNAATGEKLATLGPKQIDSSVVAFSPDGSRFACASFFDGRLRIRSSATGEVIPKGLLPDAPVRPWSIAYSPDGKRLAAAYSDSTVRLWDCERNAPLPDLSTRLPGALVVNPVVASVAFNADGSRIAAGCGDGVVLVWNAATGEVVATLLGHENTVNSVRFLSDAKLVSCSSDRTLRIWDVDKAACLEVLRGHDARVTCLAVSPDGSRIASSSNDKTVRIWSARTARCFAVLHGHEREVTCVAFGPDGTRIASTSVDGTARVWDAEMPGSMAILHEPSVGSSAPGVATGADVVSTAFSPDGSRLAAGLDDGTIQLWDPRTHAELAVLRGHRGSVNSVVYSHDGARIASAGSDRTVRIWNVSDSGHGAVAHALPALIVSVAFSPDDRTIAAVANDKTALLIDAKTGSVLRTLHGHTKALSCVAFSADGARLFTGSYDKTMRTWDTANGAEIGAPLAHSGTVESIACSPDGTRLAIASEETVHIYRTGSTEPIATCLGHDALVRSITFTPDGTRLLSAAADDTVRIWDAWTGEARLTLRAEDRGVNCVSFSPDATRIAAGSSNRTTILWETESPAVHAEERRARMLSIRAAQPVVDALFQELVASDDVVRRLEADSTLDPALRETAIRLARFRGDDPRSLAVAGARIVASPSADPKAYHRALRMMEIAWMQHPENGEYLQNLGIAQYRAGEYEKALGTLARAEPHSRGVPRGIAFQAMAEQRLGHTEAAQKTLAKLRELMKKKRWAEDTEARAVSDEAESLITSAR